MVYPEYLAFWIILLPFILQNVEAQTTEIYETMVLFNANDSLPNFNSTMISIMPSSSIIPSTTASITNDSTVTDESDITVTVESGSRLPTDTGLTTTSSASSSFPSLTPFCSQPFDCISNSILFDIATFFHSSSSINTKNGTLTCFQSINSCNDFCWRYFSGECYRISSSLAKIENDSFFNTDFNCGEVNVVCFFPYYWIIATTMILTTIAIISAIIAAYKIIKARRGSSVTLISFRYTGNFPDLRQLYNNGEQIDLQPYDTVHYDNENGNVTILSSKM